MMKKETCPQGERYLCGHLEGGLERREEEAFVEHCEQCPLCQQDLELWSRLLNLPLASDPPQPSAFFTAHFSAMLAREAGQLERSAPAVLTATSPSRNLTKLAPAAILSPTRFAWPVAAVLAIGAFLAGYGLGTVGPRPEMQQLREELRSMRSLVAVSLLQQQSTSERLRGVSYSTALQNPDHEVVDALLRTLREDSSVDVRMSAADALRRYSGQARVRKFMAETLRLESSPLVQLTLINTLVAWREQQVTPVLQFLAGDLGGRADESPRIDPTVRQRAAQALLEMQADGSKFREDYR